MSLNSINTNIAAYSAQANIGKAATSAAASVARLSSGNRIVKASDDVAALSIGTSLKTGVTTLRQALANTSQGTSLLQVADGALSQISDILQRQKAIATQANSGTLSDTERGYLNQEFQSLSSQIDQIAGSSSFSSVKLLDGSLAGAVSVKSDTQDAALPVATTPTTVFTLGGAFDVGDKITINGVEISAVATGATGNQVNVAAFDSTLTTEADNQANNLVTALNSSTDANLAKFYFSTDGTGAIQAQVRSGYTVGNQAEATISYSMEEADASYTRTPNPLFTITDKFATGDTIVLNGTSFSVVASAATGNQINVGTDTADQVAQVMTALQASTDANVAQFTYTLSTDGVTVLAQAAGTDTSYAVDTSGMTQPADITVTSPVDFASTTADDDISGANSGSVSLAQTDSGNVLAIGVGNAADGDKITVAGVTVQFTTATVGTTDASGKVKVGADNVETAANLAAFLNSSTDARLANYYFGSDSSGNLTAKLATGDIGGTTGLTLTTSVTTGANITGGSTTIADTYSKNGLGENRTRALGTVTGTLLANGGTGVASGSAIDLSGIRNNADFVGALGGDTIGNFTASYTAQDTVTFAIKVGDVTYSSAATDLNSATSQTITLNGSDANGNSTGGSFSITIQGGAVAAASINSQADANSLATHLNQSLSGLTFVQSRDVTSFDTATNVTVGGAEVARLDNVTVDLRSSDFSKFDMQSFNITAPGNGSTDAVFTAVINGQTYQSLSGIGSTFDNNTAIQLQSLTNPDNVLTIVTGNHDVASSSSVSIDVSTADNAAAVASAFQTAFGLDKAGDGLSFQVGAASNDTIGVKIAAVDTNTLYSGQTLDVTTLAGAQQASSVLDDAIATINQVRANVGALQSRLDFTSANLQASIQNQDAARGTLLDTDVATESTAYATAQVQLQAGIAVLAQANQLPQNLLKLIS